MFGKYFRNTNSKSQVMDMYYVEGQEGGEYTLRLTSSSYLAQPGLNLVERYTEEELQDMLQTGQIVEIEPPTFFIVTHRDTFSIKNDLKNAGARWDDFNKFWYFNEKPAKYKVKEVLVYPYTGKRI